MLVGVVLLLPGCGDRGADRPPAAGAPAPGGGITVEQALASKTRQPLLVRGALFAEPGEPVRLCAAVLESFPPRCGDPSLVVEGAPLDAVPGVQTAGGVTWAESVSLLGVVRDGVLTVDPTAL